MSQLRGRVVKRVRDTSRDILGRFSGAPHFGMLFPGHFGTRVWVCGIFWVQVSGTGAHLISDACFICLYLHSGKDDKAFDAAECQVRQLEKVRPACLLIDPLVGPRGPMASSQVGQFSKMREIRTGSDL